MAEPATPRRLVKAVLRGEPPPRPLLMPIVFSLGARLENLSLRDFLSNPTKIANSLRQIRNVLKVDAVTCYFDPFLEAEALGCKRHWTADGSHLTCPTFPGAGDLRHKLSPPEALRDKGCIPVACDVLQRMKLLLKDEPALMVAVNGPFALAAQLLGNHKAPPPAPSLPQELVEFAAEVTASVATIFVESGADVVFLMESAPAEISDEICEWWTSLLVPTLNVIRFYEALPVLLPGQALASGGSTNAIFRRNWECVVCPAVRDDLATWPAWNSGPMGKGLALPAGLWCHRREGPGSPLAAIANLFQDKRLSLVASATDIPATTDVKCLSENLNWLRRAFSQEPGKLVSP